MKLPQSIGLSSVRNARELGGYLSSDGRRVKSNLLLRSASLGTLSPEERELLREKYGLEMVIDFRSGREAERNPDILSGAVEYTLLPALSGSSDDKGSNTVLDKAVEQPFHEIANLALQIFGNGDAIKKFMSDEVYRTIARGQESAKAYGAFFRILLNAESAVLFHCTSGKDRTGIAAFLLLSALGVEREISIRDYLLTNKYLEIEDSTAGHGMDSETCRLQMLLQGVDASYMYAYLDEIEKNYGSLERYLEEGIGLKAPDRERLIEKYTEIV